MNTLCLGARIRPFSKCRKGGRGGAILILYRDKCDTQLSEVELESSEFFITELKTKENKIGHQTKM